MNSIKSLLDMIATEALEGGRQDHFFDKFKNPEFIREYRPPRIYQLPKLNEEIQPIKFDLELIRKPDGTYEWVE